MEKTLVVAKSQSTPVSSARTIPDALPVKMRRLPSSTFRAPSFLSAFPNIFQGKKKRIFPKGERICVVDHEVLKRDLSPQRKTHLRPLFKCTSTDRNPTENPRNFPGVFGVITFFRKTRGNLKVWQHLAGVKNAFQKFWMAQIVSGALKISTILL